jgi:hypothetical protein
VHLDQRIVHAHRDQSQSKPAAQRRHVLQRPEERPSHATRRGDIHRVRDRLPRHRLMNQGQRKTRLQFHDHRILVTAAGNDIGRPDLGLHLVTLPLQERLHRRI